MLLLLLLLMIVPCAVVSLLHTFHRWFCASHNACLSHSTQSTRPAIGNSGGPLVHTAHTYDRMRRSRRNAGGAAEIHTHTHANAQRCRGQRPNTTHGEHARTYSDSGERRDTRSVKRQPCCSARDSCLTRPTRFDLCPSVNRTQCVWNELDTHMLRSWLSQSTHSAHVFSRVLDYSTHLCVLSAALLF